MLRKIAGSLAYSLAKFSAGTGLQSSSVLKSGEKFWWGGQLTGVYGDKPAAGLSINHHTAMTLSTVFACTRARAETLASLPPMIYQEISSNTRRRDDTNPLWELLHDAPNEDMDSMTFYELLNMRQVNRGNGWCEIERDRNDRPVGLWPIHNSRVTPWRGIDGKVEWHVATDAYDPRYEKYREYIIPDRDMLNIVGFGSDGYVAPGVIDMAVEEVSASMAQSQYNASWFAKGARPSAVVEYPTYIDDDDERADFRRQVNALHSGREHWHEIPVMWHGAKWKEIQYSPEQSQLVASRQYSAKEICKFYNVPPAIVQIFDDYKFSTVDAMIQQFVMTCLRSDAVRIERAIRRKITHTRAANGRLRAVFDSPYVFEFVLDALLRGDAKKQAETLEIKRRNGIVNADDWLALDNQPPLPDGQGQIYLVPGGFENLATLGQTYPRGGVQGGSNNQTGNSASFDRNRLYQALESGIPKHHDRSPGGSVGDASTARDDMDAVAVEVLQEAVTRIELIHTKDLSRIDPSDEVKVSESWKKHGNRLLSAVLPACKIYCRYRDDHPEAVADRIVARVCSNRVALGINLTIEAFE